MYGYALPPTLPAVAVFSSETLSGQIQIIVFAQYFKQVFAWTGKYLRSISKEYLPTDKYLRRISAEYLPANKHLRRISTEYLPTDK